MSRPLLLVLMLAFAACGQKEAEEQARAEAAQVAADVEEQAKHDAEAQSSSAQPETEQAEPNPVEEHVGTADELIPFERLDTPVDADLTVDWTEAADHIGEFIAVEGTIVDTHNSGRACFLNYTTEWRGKFYLAILGSNMDDYPESPERYFLNKKVRAVGKVEMYRDRPQIVIETPQHITVLD